MVSILCIGDVHLSDKAPSKCHDSYNDDLFGLLAEIVKVADDRSVDAAVFAGDIFHIKTPSRTSHRTVQRMIDIVQSFSCSVYGVVGNHDMCVSEDTEALTDRGWLRLDQLRGDERFATLDPVTHEFVWQMPRKLFASHFSGDLLHFKSSQVDHLVTENHEVLVRPHLSRKYGDKSWRKKRADSIPSYTHWYAPAVASKWAGVRPEKVVVPPSERLSGLALAPELAADLFGWYLSEGSVELGGRIILSQSEKSPHRAEVEELVRRLGFEPSLTSSTVRFSYAPLARFLAHEFGTGSYSKFIPSWVKEWSPDLLDRLFWAYDRGDGTANGNTSRCLTTASDCLVDDLQEVCVKLGYYSVAGPRKSSTIDGYASTYRRVGVSLGQTTVGLRNPTRVSYEGMVWCPSLENGVWLTRRNGKVIWTGNSHDRLDSLSSQPFGVLLQSGMKLLDGWADGLPLYGVPWQQHWSEGEPAFDAYRRLNGRVVTDALIVTHAPLYPPGEELPWENIPASTVAGWMGNDGHLYYGHVHDLHGVFWCDGVTFCNQGAISRGSLHESDFNRKPAVTVWHSGVTGPAAFERVELESAKPGSDVFRVEEHVAAVDYRDRMDTFLFAMSRSTVQATSVESVIKVVRGMGLPDPEVELATEVLFAAASGELK